VFATSPDLSNLKELMNREIAKIKIWCDTNTLSINLKKTYYMIIKSPHKKASNIELTLPGKDNVIHTLEEKCYIKYLGVFIDRSLSWNKHISYISSKIAKNY